MRSQRILLDATNSCCLRGTIEILKMAGSPFEVLVVDDCSRDRTGEIAASCGAKVLRHGRNRGYGASLKTGIRIKLS